ncbi:MAG: hypothetical protein ACK2TV_06170, partial [Anaerolineales bacterium]
MMNRFLSSLTPDDLRHRRGFGGRILWINRGISEPDDISNSTKIIFTGPPHIGKTREALELAYRLVQNGLVAKDRVFEPSPELFTSNPYFLGQNLRSEVEFTEPLLLLLDDLPGQFDNEEKFYNLSLMIEVLQESNALFVIATASDAQMASDLGGWLAVNEFIEVPVPALNRKETAHLIAGVAGSCGIQTDYDASEYLKENGDGTPDLIIYTYFRLLEAGKNHLDLETAQRYCSDEIRELWTNIRQSLVDKDRHVVPLLKAIKHFQEARLTPFTNLILSYGGTLQIPGVISTSSRRDLENSLNKSLVRHVAFAGKRLLVDQIVTDVEGGITHEDSIDQITQFLLGRQGFLGSRRPKELDQFEEEVTQVLFELALAYEQRGDISQAIKIYGEIL